MAGGLRTQSRSRIRASRVVLPGLGYGSLMRAYKPEMGISVSLLIVGNVFLQIRFVTTDLEHT